MFKYNIGQKVTHVQLGKDQAVFMVLTRTRTEFPSGYNNTYELRQIMPPSVAAATFMAGEVELAPA